MVVFEQQLFRRGLGLFQLRIKIVFYYCFRNLIELQIISELIIDKLL